MRVLLAQAQGWGFPIFTVTIDKSHNKATLNIAKGRHQEETTVHLLGGANMSNDGTGHGGVTNHLGEVFSGSNGEVYKGLVCCDASIIPTALGMLQVKIYGLLCADSDRREPTRHNISPLRAIRQFDYREIWIIN